MSLYKSLVKKAEELRAQSPEYTAVQMLKQAGMTEDQARLEVAQTLMEKEAASSMVAQGVDYDAAMAMIKVAGIKVSDLNAFKPEQTFEEEMAELLMKVASDVKALEKKAARVEELESEAESMREALASVEAEIPAPITKLAESGAFTWDDLEALKSLPSETLTKVASANEAPWRMGKSAGMAQDSMDPLTSFLLG